MYADYIRERENKEILQNDFGFAIYGYNCVPGVDFPHVYLQDIYVKPEHRKKNHASQLADQVAAQAKTAGFKVMLGSVDGTANGADASLRFMFAYGASLFSISGSVAWFTKELK